MNRAWIAIFFLILLSINSLHAGLLPDYDRNCDHLIGKKCPTRDILATQDRCNEQVPRIIHRIWFGNKDKLSQENRKSWENYADQLGYQYHFWTEENISELRSLMDNENFSLIGRFITLNNWWAASDILRLELIKNFGGIYLDCDFNVPKIDGNLVDLHSIINDRGLSLMCEHKGREIGANNAIFVANGFIAAPQGHTMIEYAVRNIKDNIESWRRAKPDYNAMYITGPFYLNRILNGKYSVIPVTFFEELGSQ